MKRIMLLILMFFGITARAQTLNCCDGVIIQDNEILAMRIPYSPSTCKRVMDLLVQFQEEDKKDLQMNKNKMCSAQKGWVEVGQCTHGGPPPCCTYTGSEPPWVQKGPDYAISVLKNEWTRLKNERTTRLNSMINSCNEERKSEFEQEQKRLAEERKEQVEQQRKAWEQQVAEEQRRREKEEQERLELLRIQREQEEKLKASILADASNAVKTLKDAADAFVDALSKKTDEDEKGELQGLIADIDEEKQSIDQSSVYTMKNEVSGLSDLEFNNEEVNTPDQSRLFEGLFKEVFHVEEASFADMIDRPSVENIYSVADQTVERINGITTIADDMKNDRIPEALPEFVLQSPNPVMEISSDYAVRSANGAVEIVSSAARDIEVLASEDETKQMELNDDIFKKVDPIEYAKHDLSFDKKPYPPLTVREFAGIVAFGGLAVAASVTLPAACLIAAMYGFHR